MPTLYVNVATGNDARSYVTAQNPATPWATIGRASRGSAVYAANAAAAAQPGDTVEVAAGVYWETGSPTGGRWDVALSPANSGTIGSPIRFLGIGSVYVRLVANVFGPSVGSNGRDNIIWENFIVDDHYGGSKEDTGPVVLYNASYCQLLRCEVQGMGNAPGYHNYQHPQEGHIDIATNGNVTPTAGWATFFLYYAMQGRTIVAGGITYTITADATSHSLMNVTPHPGSPLTNLTFTASAFGGNYRLVGLEQIDHCTIKNNRIHGSKLNAGGILAYDASDNIIEHNEVYDVSLGIYLKGRHDGFTMSNNIIRYNYVHDNRQIGIRTESTKITLVHQNIVHGCPSGYYLGAFGPDRTRVINNLAYNCSESAFELVEAAPANWSASTAYVLEDRRYNGVNIYVCTTAGISAASGGPTGTGTGITDGSVVWDYSPYKIILNCEFKNNISQLCGIGYSSWTAGSPAEQQFTANYNMYRDINGSPAVAANFHGYATGNFAAWRALGLDVNYSTADPLLVNPGAFDFHLQGGSPARNFGIGVYGVGGNDGGAVHAGPYITGNEVIGIEETIIVPAPLPVRQLRMR
ncbi:MAG: right-handed parallel beta-helix repeat-containing protein [Nitrospirota bacterium]|nr:right-handed parallel beta-helix repeat-containing protein [Nitrospirota bacterium]